MKTLNTVQESIISKNTKNTTIENTKNSFGKYLMGILNTEIKISPSDIRKKTELTLAKMFGLTNDKIGKLEKENLQSINLEQIMKNAEGYFKKNTDKEIKKIGF